MCDSATILVFLDQFGQNSPRKFTECWSELFPQCLEEWEGEMGVGVGVGWLLLNTLLLLHLLLLIHLRVSTFSLEVVGAKVLLSGSESKSCLRGCTSAA